MVSTTDHHHTEEREGTERWRGRKGGGDGKEEGTERKRGRKEGGRKRGGDAKEEGTERRRGRKGRGDAKEEGTQKRRGRKGGGDGDGIVGRECASYHFLHSDTVGAQEALPHSFIRSHPNASVECYIH